MRWTIGRKLAVLIGVGLAGLWVMAEVGLRGIDQLNRAFADVVLTSSALRNHMEADMMHDGIRADVLRVLAAEEGEELKAATQELADHVEHIKDMMAENEKLPLSPLIATALRNAHPELNAYVDAAEGIATRARRDRIGARSGWNGFQVQFEALEERMGAISDLIEKKLNAAQADADDTSKRGARLIWVIGIVAAAVTAGLTLLISRSIARAVGRAMSALGAVAERDLTPRLRVRGSDELAQMGSALNAALDGITTTVRAFAQKAAALSDSSNDLSAVSQRMNTAAGETAGQAGAVAAAAAEATHNIETVSFGIEEMGTAIQAIARSAMEATEVVANAVAAANSASSTIQRLGASSAEVGAVVKVITTIAEQANLLALNATIEAARAGDMGKGFAVVANEVKELANETARATEDIGKRIEAIQRDSSEAVVAISQVSQVVGKMHDLQGAIAAAVEEQNATTTEIKRNVMQVARASGNISSTITQVAAVADRSTETAGETRAAVTRLAELASELGALASAFHYEQNAAAQGQPAL